MKEPTTLKTQMTFAQNNEIALYEIEPLPRIKITSKLKFGINKANNCLKTIVQDEENWDLLKINTLVYAAAMIIPEKQQKIRNSRCLHRSNQLLLWQMRLISKVEQFKKDLSNLVLNET